MLRNPADPDSLFALSAALERLADALEAENRLWDVARVVPGLRPLGLDAMALAADLHECALFNIVPADARLDDAERVLAELERELARCTRDALN